MHARSLVPESWTPRGIMEVWGALGLGAGARVRLEPPATLERALLNDILGALRAAGAGVVLVLPGSGRAPQWGVDAALLAQVEALEVVVHASSSAVHDRLAQCPGALKQVGLAVAGAVQSGKELTVRLPLWSSELQDLPRLMHWLGGLARTGNLQVTPELFPLGMPGLANSRLVPPPMTGLRQRLKELLAQAQSAGVDTATENSARLPLCALNTLPAPLPTLGSGEVQRYARACSSCDVQAHCAGVPTWYLESHGERAVSPLRQEDRGEMPSTAAWLDATRAWQEARDLWEKAAGSGSSGGLGDSSDARATAWRALGFTGEAPAKRSDASRAAEPLPEDSTAARIEQAIRKFGVGRLEEVMFRAGLKPVLYLTPSPPEVARLRERYSDVEVAVVEGDDIGGRGVSRTQSHFFAGRDAALVARVSEVYRSGDPTGSAALMGEAMGYPSCCTQAFAQARDNRSDSRNIARSSLASGATRHALLNLGVANLIPFYPCSFSCDAAEHVARRVLELLFEDPRERQEIESAMAQALVFFDKERSLLLGSPDEPLRADALHLSCRSGHGATDRAMFGSLLADLLKGASSLEFGRDSWSLAWDGEKTRVLTRDTDAPAIYFPPATLRTSAGS